ncbi:hypothetical protein VTK56DRAFT_3549 [Thermocarpiscus australiensis]
MSLSPRSRNGNECEGKGERETRALRVMVGKRERVKEKSRISRQPYHGMQTKQDTAWFPSPLPPITVDAALPLRISTWPEPAGQLGLDSLARAFPSRYGCPWTKAQFPGIGRTVRLGIP